VHILNSEYAQFGQGPRGTKYEPLQSAVMEGKMNIDNKMIMELAEQIGLSSKSGPASMKNAEKRAAQYVNKSDEELVHEILKLKESMKRDKASFEKQMTTIKALGSIMKGEQKARLQKIVDLLES